MAEVYVGVNFQSVFMGRCPPVDSRIDKLEQWCHTLAQWGVVGQTVGNLSFRTATGFIISRTAADLATIGAEEFVEVVEADVPGRKLTVIGAYEPSSESLMHATIYQA